jgi:hypothetical protein
VFKANSAVLNSLLTILNERLFDNGNARVPVPLLCLVGASNELPDSEELDALYDRFLLRCAVAQVSDAGVDTLLALPARNGDGGDGHHASGDGDGGTPQLQLRAEALAGVRRAAAGVEVPPDIRGLLKELRTHLQQLQPPVYVSGAYEWRMRELCQLRHAHALTHVDRPTPGESKGAAADGGAHVRTHRRQRVRHVAAGARAVAAAGGERADSQLHTRLDRTPRSRAHAVLRPFGWSAAARHARRPHRVRDSSTRYRVAQLMRGACACEEGMRSCASLLLELADRL